MYQKVFHAVLNKIALTKCAVEQTQNYRFQPFLPSFYWKAMLPTQTNMAIFVLRDSKSTQNDISFLFSFTHLYFNCQFAILVGHFKLEKLMENAGSQSQTMSWAEKHNISIWRKLYKKWKRESAAKWIRKRAIMTSYKYTFQKNEKSFTERRAYWPEEVELCPKSCWGHQKTSTGPQTSSQQQCCIFSIAA